jgi:hypothetical protein
MHWSPRAIGPLASLASDESARKLEKRGIRAVRDDITDAGSVREATRGAVLDVLRGTGRTFVYNSGVWVMGDTPKGVDLARRRRA